MFPESKFFVSVVEAPDADNDPMGQFVLEPSAGLSKLVRSDLAATKGTK